jgi:hypothetical protein
MPRPYGIGRCARVLRPLVLWLPLLLLPLHRALAAEDIGASALAYLETLTWRDSLKNWDQVRAFGAERINDRVRPEYQPRGIKLPGGHIVLPVVGLKTTWDDNIFLDQGAAKQGDLRTELDARAKLLSNLPRHMFNVDVMGRFTKFKDHDDLDYTDGRVFAEARVDIDSGNVMGGTLSRSLLHEDRFAAEAPRAAREPVAVLTDRLETAFLHDRGRLSLLAGAELRKEDYTDVRSYTGEIIDQDSRDVIQGGVFGRAGYRHSPGYSTFLGLRYDRQTFTADGAGHQDNNRYAVEVGAKVEANALVRFEGAVGYDYTDLLTSNNADSGLFLYRGQVEWLATQRMTVTLGAKRGREYTPSGYGVTSTTYEGVLQYDIFNDTELKLEVAKFDQEFQGSDRRDGTWIAGAKLYYWFNRNAKLTLEYDYRHKDSTDDDNDYEDNRVTAGVKFSF